ncbi:MAG: P-type conjugative transfer protein TrbJ [Caulobacter sp. 32-67-35]|nr:MAG: P-type conjugative transfer protein TrbJ [Caulobacter sp. 32-67-35]HQR89225.1 P-type conjugative transfer protein TrbJ [Caulobacter sp.]
MKSVISRRNLMLGLVSLGAVAAPAAAQLTVNDPMNYAQNVVQAARSLEQINHQIASLQNEATMLVNQARNLESLPVSSLTRLQAQVSRTQALLGQAQRLAYDVDAVETAFKGRYGAARLGATEQDLVARAQERWATSVGAFEDALKVQAGVVGGLETSRAEMQTLVTASQNATGALQAAQAGNQLLSLQSQQLAQITALLAAQGRAQALEASDRAAAQQDARARFQAFMGKSGATQAPKP